MFWDAPYIENHSSADTLLLPIFPHNIHKCWSQIVKIIHSMFYLFITLVCLVRGQNVDLGSLSPQISSYHVLDYDLSLLEKQQHQNKVRRHRRSVSYGLADSYADHSGVVTLNIVAFNRWVVHSFDGAADNFKLLVWG